VPKKLIPRQQVTSVIPIEQTATEPIKRVNTAEIMAEIAL